MSKKPRAGNTAGSKQRVERVRSAATAVVDGDIFKTGDPILKALPPPTTAAEIVDRAWLSIPWMSEKSSRDGIETATENIRQAKLANAPNRDLARELLDRLLLDPRGPHVESSQLLKALGKDGARNYLSNHENTFEEGASDDQLVIADYGALHGGKRYWRPSVIRVLATKWVDGVPDELGRQIDALPRATAFVRSQREATSRG
jgi:hypothetical protein